MSTGSIFVAALALPEEQSVAGGELSFYAYSWLSSSLADQIPLAVSQTLVRLGGSFGVATTTVIANAYTVKGIQAGLTDVDALLNGLHASFWLGAGFSFSALFIAIAMLRGLGVISKEKKAEPPKSDVEAPQPVNSEKKEER